MNRKMNLKTAETGEGLDHFQSNFDKWFLMVKDSVGKCENLYFAQINLGKQANVSVNQS